MLDSHPVQQAEAQPLATLVHLQRRARLAADELELNFILVNESYQLAPYRQSAAWMRRGGVVALSGVASLEANAPYLHWLTQLCAHCHRLRGGRSAWLLAADELPSDIAAQWSDWLPAHVLLLILPVVGQRFDGGCLVLARDEAWRAAEITLMEEWVAAWSYARASFVRRKYWPAGFWHGGPDGVGERAGLGAAGAGQVAKRWLGSPKILLSAAIALCLIVPVRLTVLAPADLIPLDPHIVRAPLDGVVERILVGPNQQVRAGAPLLEFDRVAVTNRLQIAQGALATVAAGYRQRAQQALLDPSSTAELAALQGQIREKEIEVAYLHDLLERGVIQAPADGVVLMGDPGEWVGRPVVTGERILVVANESAVEIEAWLSPGDAIPMAAGARLRLYLNADPLAPVEGAVRYVAHEAVLRPDGQYAYRIRAALTGPKDARLRIGLKGTAKIEGERVPFIYWMLRRPLAALRAWSGV